jgi:hypothetical protein
MEEHCEAYFAWKQAGLRAAWCWHVDAHLDIGRDGLEAGRLQALAECSSFAEARSRNLCGNAYLPWGGLHCGNYLYAAIQEGIVARLTWVIPPDLPVGPLLGWVRAHLNGWFDLTVLESVQLQEKAGYVTGTVLGIPMDIGVSDRLPQPSEPVLLDVDLDYFLTTRGELWRECEDFPASRFTTVAYSVKGGFTPTAYRRLARAWVADVSGYEADPLDEAASLVRLQRYAEALPKLQSLDSVESGYLQGTCHHHLGQHEEALALWQELLQRGDLPPEGRAYLEGLASEALCRLERAPEALEMALQAQQRVEPDYRLYWAAGAALEKMGELRQATQMVRRGLRLAEPYLFGLQMRLALARLYRMQNKEGLARLELAQLEKADLGGQLRPLTLLR